MKGRFKFLGPCDLVRRKKAKNLHGSAVDADCEIGRDVSESHFCLGVILEMDDLRRALRRCGGVRAGVWRRAARSVDNPTACE